MSEIVIFAGQVGVIAIAGTLTVMALTVFFRWLPWIEGKQRGRITKSASDLFPPDAVFTVRLNSGETVERVTYEGQFVREGSDDLPFSMDNLGVFRDAQGRRVILRIGAVRALIEQGD